MRFQIHWLRVSTKWIGGVVLFAQFSAVGHAGLEWSQRVLEKSWNVGQKSESFVFRFKNTGNYPVTISAVKASCGCTTAVLSKHKYLPGETGSVLANFQAGNREGLQEKRVIVLTDDPKASQVVLTLKTTIPVYASIKPQWLSWDQGETPIAKTSRLILAKEAELRVVSKTLASRHFVIETTETNGDYIVSVRPRSTKTDVSDRLVLGLKSSDGMETTLALDLRIGTGSRTPVIYGSLK
ncbi:MAG: DUF1573 domain-containing protein [Verrucomicrobiota bacterium]